MMFYTELENINKQYHRLTGKQSMLQSQLASLSSDIDAYTRSNRIADEARVLITKTADAQVEGVTQYLSLIVTSALRHVFGEGFKFHVTWDRTTRGGTVDFMVESPYKGETITDDPKDARGGGVQNVVDFALWVTLLNLAGNNSTICLDEPWHWLSVDHIPAMVEFLWEVQERMGWQVIMVTSHQLPELNEEITELGGKAFKVVKSAGTSVVKSI